MKIPLNLLDRFMIKAAPVRGSLKLMHHYHLGIALDPERLSKALHQMVKEIPLIHSSLSAGGRYWLPQDPTDVRPYLKVMDVEDPKDEIWSARFVEKMMEQPINLSSDPTFQVILRRGRGESLLAIISDHTLLDGASLIYLVSYLLGKYEDLGYQSPLPPVRITDRALSLKVLGPWNRIAGLPLALCLRLRRSIRPRLPPSQDPGFHEAHEPAHYAFARIDGQTMTMVDREAKRVGIPKGSFAAAIAARGAARMHSPTGPTRLDTSVRIDTGFDCFAIGNHFMSVDAGHIHATNSLTEIAAQFAEATPPLSANHADIFYLRWLMPLISRQTNKSGEANVYVSRFNIPWGNVPAVRSVPILGAYFAFAPSIGQGGSNVLLIRLKSTGDLCLTVCVRGHLVNGRSRADDLLDSIIREFQGRP